MLTVVGKETHVREGESPAFGADPDGPVNVRYLQFLWADLYQARYEIMGYSTRTAAGVLSRNLPEQHPVDPGLFACRVSFVKGVGSSGYTESSTLFCSGGASGTSTARVAKYKRGVLRVDYAWRPYDVLCDAQVSSEYQRFVEVDENGQTDYITPPTLRFGQMKWVGGGADVAGKNAFATFGKLIPFANLTMIWHQVPYRYIPLTAIRASYGKVSNAALTNPNDANTTYAAGSLLFCGAGRRRNAMSYFATPSCDLKYYFRFDDATIPGGAIGGPNSFPCFKESPFVRRLISDDGTDPGIGARNGKCVYDEFNPNALFTVA